MRALLVLPTYNEADNVSPLLQRVRELQPELDVVVVDDASPDGTAELVRRRMAGDPRLQLVERSGKGGLGSAYAAGFGLAISRGYDAAIQMDCDFSHPPERLGELLARLAEFDLVVGSRYVPGGSVKQWSRFRRTLSRTANRFARGVLGIPIRDLTGGFNAWRTSALQRVGYDRLGSRGYAFQIELKLRAWRVGLRWVEVPVTFVERREGVSKIPRTEVFTAFWQVVHWRLRPPRPEPHE